MPTRSCSTSCGGTADDRRSPTRSARSPPSAQEAARAKDFAAADALRDRDRRARLPRWSTRPRDRRSSRSRAAEAAARVARRATSPSVLDEPPTCDVSVHWVVEGWPEDVVRALAGFRAHEGGRDVQYVVADVTETDPAVYGDGVEVLALEAGTGWGAARNAGLKRSRGRIVLVMDGSVEPTGDVLGPLEAALADPSVGVCGPFGIVDRATSASSTSRRAAGPRGRRDRGLPDGVPPRRAPRRRVCSTRSSGGTAPPTSSARSG